jgi:nucleoside-diphosphate-sugar epimerase
MLGKIGDQRIAAGGNFILNSEKAWTSILFHWFDNSKAKTELGLKPRSHSDALRDSVQWMKEQKLV